MQTPIRLSTGHARSPQRVARGQTTVAKTLTFIERSPQRVASRLTWPAPPRRLKREYIEEFEIWRRRVLPLFFAHVIFWHTVIDRECFHSSLVTLLLMRMLWRHMFLVTSFLLMLYSPCLDAHGIELP